jgi:cobalamin biosynthesis protein CobT
VSKVTYQNLSSKERPDVAKRLQSIMTAQRRGKHAPEFGKRRGRVDARKLTRAAVGDGRVFKTRGAPSPTHLRLVVLLDMSGSMSYGSDKHAVQMCRDLIEATKDTRSITTEVWGHTTNSLQTGDSLQPEAERVREGDYIVLRELWEEGQPIKTLHDRINTQQFWGNEDGFAIDSLYKDVARRRKSNERVLMVVISDGEPVITEMTKARAHVRQVSERIRRAGDAVISVSCSMGLRKDQQEEMYGHEFVIEYTANTLMLTQAIAKSIGKALN